MDYWESLKKTTADMSYMVAKKTGEFVETSKIKYRIYDLKAEIKKIQTKIGHEVYTAYAEEREVSDIIEEKCREIDTLKEKLDELTEMLKKEDITTDVYVFVDENEHGAVMEAIENQFNGVFDFCNGCCYIYFINDMKNVNLDNAYLAQYNMKFDFGIKGE